jgi:ABC-type branched-subunit amino acid transport system ATPase component
MEVRLFLRKGDDEYEIYRCRGETFNIQVLCNGEDITLDSVSGNDKLVEEIIGMSYELFTKIIVFSGNSIPFLMLPVSQQRSQIEELFKITLLTEKAILLKEKIKQTEGDINIQEALIKQQENAVKLYRKQIKDAEDRIARWDMDRDTQAEKLLTQLTASDGVDMELEKQLHDLIAELEPKALKLEQAYKTEKNGLDNATKELKRLWSEHQHLEEAKCPYCLQQFADANAKIQEILKDIEMQNAFSDVATDAVEYQAEELRKVKEQIDEARGLIKFNSLAQAIQAQATASSAQQKIDDLLSASNPHIEALESLKRNAVDEINYDMINALKKELDHQQFLLKLLTDKNSFIRRRIINQTIPFLNGRLNTYTKELGLQHIVKFDDDMSCTVSEYGRELDFGNLSSGEKKRVNLSLSLAFRDVLHHLHAKVNCLFIDEIDASLDNSGVENVFKLLKSKTRDDGLGMWIISHRPEAAGRFDRSIIVRKENGFSQIVEEELA